MSFSTLHSWWKTVPYLKHNEIITSNLYTSLPELSYNSSDIAIDVCDEFLHDLTLILGLESGSNTFVCRLNGDSIRRQIQKVNMVARALQDLGIAGPLFLWNLKPHHLN